MIIHKVKVYPSKIHLPKKNQLAWKIAEIASDNSKLNNDAIEMTINRIIDVFPPEQQEQIRAQISTSLKMVVTQRLLKTKDGQGRCGAFEVMKCTAPIQNLIREAKIHQIPSIMQTAVKDGMITMAKSLEDLVKAGKIDASAGKEH